MEGTKEVTTSIIIIMDVQKLTFLHTFQGPQLITTYHLLIEYFTSGITQIRLNIDPKRVFKLYTKLLQDSLSVVFTSISTKTIFN